MIQLKLQPELEEELRAAATRNGQTAEEYATSLVEKQIAAKVAEAAQPNYRDLPPEQWIEKFNEWVASHKPNAQPLSDWAVSRDSMYD